MADQDLSKVILKEVAREEVMMRQEFRRLNIEEHSSTFKWLLASLLAVNSGGTVAVLNSSAIDTLTKVRAGGAFALGIFFAFLVGVVSQRIAIRCLPPLNSQIGYWLSVVQDGVRDEPLEAKLNDDFKKAVRLAWLSPVIGWLSGLSFFAGLAVIASGLK